MPRTVNTVPPVRVPRNDNNLAPVSADRVDRLREHLCALLDETRAPSKARRILKIVKSPLPSDPAGFAGRVAAAACAVCAGWCCKNGGDDAFLDDDTLARVRRDRPDLDPSALVRLYVGHVAAPAYEDSCVFHAERGCALDRSLRSDLCNTYFCRGLDAYLKSGAPAVPTTIIAGAGAKARTASVAAPSRPMIRRLPKP